MDAKGRTPFENSASRAASRSGYSERRSGTPPHFVRFEAGDAKSVGGGEAELSGRQRGQGTSAQYHRFRYLRRHRGGDRRPGSRFGFALDQEGQASVRTIQKGRHS